MDFYKPYFRIVFVVCLLLLLGAYYLEYAYSLPVCELCWDQRYIFFALLAASFIAIMLNRLKKLFLAVITILFIANFCVALYQVLAEYHFIDPPSTCSGSIPSSNLSIEEYKARLKSNSFIPCDAAGIKIFDLSLASYSMLINAVFSIFSIIFCFAFIFFKYDPEKTS